MEGIDWTPVSEFSGILDGNGKTISNLNITSSAPKSKNMGMFGDITEDGKIKNLHLENVTVQAEKTDAENIGTFAGVVGKADIRGGETLSVTDDAGIYTTSKLTADVKLFVGNSETVQRGLAGEVEADAYVTGQWRDSFQSSQRLSETIRGRQQRVVDYM